MDKLFLMHVCDSPSTTENIIAVICFILLFVATYLIIRGIWKIANGFIEIKEKKDSKKRIMMGILYVGLACLMYGLIIFSYSAISTC